ncbi:hypothetical protein CEP53_001020 [Fusarium sp. AF-6]|nr:hypothetical protein CEP53_001020 [Fusarium sp. AF-6]
MVPQQWFGASKRALEASQGGPAWAMMSKVKKLPQYDAEKRPHGLIDLSGAENGLMEDWMGDFAKSNDGHVAPENSLSYGAISGSDGLLVAMASFFNRFFAPYIPIQPSNILVANGVTSLIDLIAWSLCDAGDGVVYPTPNFYMLEIDLTLRSNVITVPVSCSQVADPFKASGADALVACLEEGIDAATRRGINCRVLFICNPANPQGRCYSKRTLVALRELCSRRRMHLVSDEIYAMSQFQPETTQAAALDDFSSVLSLPQEDSQANIPSNVHCLYGLSKDFGMGGLRMSFLVTQNEQVLDAMKRVTWFTWVSNFSDAFVKNFMSQPDKVQEYMTTYRSRLTQAYQTTSSTLTANHIPFQEANCGLFVSVNLSGWLECFANADSSTGGQSGEIQLCEYLVDHGVFLNSVCWRR